jgi:hypothetical protein
MQGQMLSVWDGIRSTATDSSGNGAEGCVGIGTRGGVSMLAMPGPTRRNSKKGC